MLSQRAVTERLRLECLCLGRSVGASEAKRAAPAIVIPNGSPL